LRAEHRRAAAQREVLLEIGAIGGYPEGVTDPLFLDPDMNAEDAGAVLRALLGLDQLPRATWSRPPDALRAVIQSVEQLDVLVVQMQGVSRAEAQGFSIADRPLPVVALNGQDWPRPRLFTLLHELTHVAIRNGGVCDLHEVAPTVDAEEADRLEQYCNRVAAAALMPAALVTSDPLVRMRPPSSAWTLDELSELSRRFGASSESVLLRLVQLNKATWNIYHSRLPELHAAYESALEDERARMRASEGGPSFYTIKARNLGHGYVAEVLDAYRSRSISSLDVADYLDVRYDQIAKLEAAVAR